VKGSVNGIVIVVILAVLVATVALVCFSPEREPSYGGRSLSQWLQVPGKFSPEGTRVDEAIRHIGTNALPCLFRWIRAKPPPCSRLVESRKLPQWLLYLLLRSPPGRFLWHDRFDDAGVCIMMLGADARPVIPALVQVINRSKDPYRVSRAMLALSFIGEDSAPALANCLQDPREDVRVAAAAHLGQFGAKARPVLPALLGTLSDPSPWVREITTNALRKIAPEELEKTAGADRREN
jgi:hypothetical protein